MIRLLRNRYAAGFTLIEIMLVILVVALLTLYGVRVMNESLFNSQINRAANQISSIQAALFAYYKANNAQWPTSGGMNELTALTEDNPAYLPSVALCSPFSSSTSNTLCGNYQYYQGGYNPSSRVNGKQQLSYYQLTIVTPSTKAAESLASAVPNAWVDNTSVNIAILPPPILNSGNNQGWIVSAGAVSFYRRTGSNSYWNNPKSPDDYPGTQIFLPNCPYGYEGHIIFSPERYESNAVDQDWGIHLAQATNKGAKQDNSINTCPGSSCGGSDYYNNSVVYNTGQLDNHGNAVFAVSYGDSPDAYTTSVQHIAFYMTFCLPSKADSNGNTHWATHYVNNMWLQDAQCSPSWHAYSNNSPGTVCNSTDGTTASASYTTYTPDTLGPPVGSADAY